MAKCRRPDLCASAVKAASRHETRVFLDRHFCKSGDAVAARCYFTAVAFPRSSSARVNLFN